MKISPFRKGFDRDGFDCGEESLNAYLRIQAAQDLKQNVASCFVLHAKEPAIDPIPIDGFYTLSAFSVLLGTVPEALRKRLPCYPQVPVILLGRLAVSKAAQGRGWGKMLMVDALKRSLRVRETIGAWAVVVDPLNDSAAHFYRKFGFIHFGGESGVLQMFLTMKDLEGNLR